MTEEDLLNNAAQAYEESQKAAQAYRDAVYEAYEGTDLSFGKIANRLGLTPKSVQVMVVREGARRRASEE